MQKAEDSQLGTEQRIKLSFPTDNYSVEILKRLQIES